VNRLMKLATGVLVSLLVVTYVAAKIHFFTKFDAKLHSYWAEHWPYTAALALISVMLWGIVALTPRRPGA
jgi:hypothetical protein